MKQCTKCGVSKAAEFFYKNVSAEDGLTSACNVCLSQYQKTRRAKLGALKPSDWKKKTADKAAYMREWKAKNPTRMTLLKKRWLENNPQRAKVKDAVKYALKTGKLTRLPCFVCGELKSQGHHPDYSRPLDVVWLCKPHHDEVHRI
jgi:hypothetical protein